MYPYRSYPKCSILSYILYGSNYNQLSSYDTSESSEGGEEDSAHNFVLPSHEEEDNEEEEMFAFIRTKLTNQENAFLEEFLSTKKGKGQHKQVVKLQLSSLQEKIKQIISESSYQEFIDRNFLPRT